MLKVGISNLEQIKQLPQDTRRLPHIKLQNDYGKKYGIYKPPPESDTSCGAYVMKVSQQESTYTGEESYLSPLAPSATSGQNHLNIYLSYVNGQNTSS